MELNLRGDEVERWGVFVAELDQERIITRSFDSRTALLPPLCPSVYHTSAMGLGLS